MNNHIILINCFGERSNYFPFLLIKVVSQRYYYRKKQLKHMQPYVLRILCRLENLEIKNNFIFECSTSWILLISLGSFIFLLTFLKN